MNILSSLRSLTKTLATDFRLSLHGMMPGQYTRIHYRDRVRSRRGKEAPKIECSIRVDGKRIHLYLTSAHAFTMANLFLGAEYDLRKFLNESPKLIVDLGANAGMATAYMNAVYPDAQFICVEPDPRNLPLLEQTIQANQIRAKVVPAAVSSEAGELILRFGDNPTCSALETSPMHDLSSGVKVPVRTVPDLLSESGWSHIDLLKIDIEGTEKDLLGSYNEWLKRVKAIVLEIHPNTSEQEINSFINPFGFSLTRIQKSVEPVFFAQKKSAKD